MRAPSSKIQWLVWGGLGSLCAALLVASVWQRTHSLPSGCAPLPNFFSVPDFALTNQTGQVVTLADLRGKLWLVDIIFTRCAGPCPDMTRRMSELQAQFASEPRLRLITLTTDPGHDTPAVLAAYARRFGAEEGRWHFLTGTKRQIAALAVEGLKLTAQDKDPAQQENPNDLFIHSSMLVLVDGEGRARGIFESDDPELKTKTKLAVTALLRERVER